MYVLSDAPPPHPPVVVHSKGFSPKRLSFSPSALSSRLDFKYISVTHDVLKLALTLVWGVHPTCDCKYKQTYASCTSLCTSVCTSSYVRVVCNIGDVMLLMLMQTRDARVLLIAPSDDLIVP